jgi:hypothetical protein
MNSTDPEEEAIETIDPDSGADTTAPDAADGPTDDTEAATQEHASAEVMALLGEHVPLALLADLAQPEGPASPTILKDEGLPDVPWWE